MFGSRSGLTFAPIVAPEGESQPDGPILKSLENGKNATLYPRLSSELSRGA